MFSHRSLPAVVIPLAVLTVGCATNRSIPISSTPSGATVFVNGKAVGATPLILTTDDLMPNRAFDGKPSADAMIVIEKSGFSSYQLLVKEFALPDSIDAHLEPHGEVAAPPESPDLLQELERLQELRAKGTISEEEFQRLKQQAIERSEELDQQ